MKKVKYFGLLLVLCLILSLAVACAPSDYTGTYQYSSTSYIYVDSFDGTDGRAVVTNIIVKEINDGKAYSTPENGYESFKATKSSNDIYKITITISNKTIIGSFDTKNMKIILDGRTYSKV